MKLSGEGLQKRLVDGIRAVREARERVPHWVHTTFRVAECLGTNLPNRQSGLVSGAMQTVTALHQAAEIISPRMHDPVEAYARKLELVQGDNAYLSALIFGTPLRGEFAFLTSRVNDEVSVTRARHPNVGDFYFFHATGTKAEDLSLWDPTYWHTKGAGLEQLVEQLWATHEGRMRAYALSSLNHPGYGMVLAPMPRAERRLFAGARPRVQALIDRHRRFAARGVSRAYMFHGPPGTGKTTSALAMTDELGSRLLKVDAMSIVHLGLDKIVKVFAYLAPEFLLVDDVDKILHLRSEKHDEPAGPSSGMHASQLLDLVEGLKEACPKMGVLFTCNRVEVFDPGLMRPGRVDTWVEFSLPDLVERREVLRGYLQELALDVGTGDLELLADAAAGLSHDYLREVAQSVLDSGGVEEPVEMLRRSRALLDKVRA